MLTACSSPNEAIRAQRDPVRAPLRDESSVTPASAPSVDLATIREPASTSPPLRKDNTVFAGAELMGTRMTIKVWVDPAGAHTAADAGAAIELAFAELDRIEQIASEWRPESELSRLNAAAGSWVALSPDLFALLERSKEIARESGGAFDPTFHAVGQLWSFAPDARPPTAAAIKRKLALVNWRLLELDQEEPPRARLATAGMMIGLGAIAKGYGVDRASAVLRARGFPHHIVEGGGDTYVSGTKGGSSWMVGIQRPEGIGTIGALPVRDRAVVTSGGYQRFFEYEGKRYAHILDPRTGWALDEAKSALSVTVVAANATDADAFCTAIMVMGPQEGMKFVTQHASLEAVIIPRTGPVEISPGLRSSYVVAPGQARPPSLPPVP